MLNATDSHKRSDMASHGFVAVVRIYMRIEAPRGFVAVVEMLGCIGDCCDGNQRLKTPHHKHIAIVTVFFTMSGLAAAAKNIYQKHFAIVTVFS